MTTGAEQVAITVAHVAEAVWMLYGVSTRIGRAAERAYDQSKLVAFALDDRGPENYGENPLLAVVGRCTRKFTKRMSREQYHVLSGALTSCVELIHCCLTAEVEALGKQHRRIRYWHRMAALVLRFADKLDDQE